MYNKKEETKEMIGETFAMERDYEQMASIFKALGHPVRMRIFTLLAEQGESYCGDMVSLVGVAQSTVSHHLKILKESGLVATEEQGTFVCYRVQRERLRELAHLLTSL